jgi:ERCC4-type nuclease
VDELFKLHITIDTREQTPWHFSEHLAITNRATIKQGDYCVKDDEGFAIERKELNDFIQTIFSGWERFQDELKRMDKQNFPARIIIVESDYKRVCFTYSDSGEIEPPDHEHYKITPQGVNSKIAELSMMGVSVIFAGNPQYASALAYAILSYRNMFLINGGIK